MPHMRLGKLNIGTIGHIDHGKTTVTAAITKVLAKHNPKHTLRRSPACVGHALACPAKSEARMRSYEGELKPAAD